MSDLRESLKTEFQELEYRYGYAESFLNTKLATQIKTLREQRVKTQAEAAALMGIKQPGYQRFEDINHSVWKTDTLWSIARAYGVRLDISFKTFGSLLDDKKRFNRENLKVSAFEEDPAFKEPPVKDTKAKDALAAAVDTKIVPPTPSFGLVGGDQKELEQVRAAALGMQSALKQMGQGGGDLSWLGNSLEEASRVIAETYLPRDARLKEIAELGSGAAATPPPQPSEEQTPDRNRGLYLVPVPQGAVPRLQQGPEINREATPHPCGSREEDGLIGTKRKLPHRLRLRDARRKSRA